MDFRFRSASRGDRSPRTWLVRVLVGVVTGVLALSALVAALLLAFVGLIVGGVLLIVALVTGRKPQFRWNIRRGGWRRQAGEPDRATARPGVSSRSARGSGEIVDIEAREVPERLDR
jgi:hypothetical protein